MLSMRVEIGATGQPFVGLLNIFSAAGGEAVNSPLIRLIFGPCSSLDARLL